MRGPTGTRATEVPTTSPHPRRVTLCVDDFGLHAGVNEAVHALLAQRRISAVSCLVDGPQWVSGAGRLLEDVLVEGDGHDRLADVGLHLNFTELLDAQAQTLVPPMPLGKLIRSAYLGGLSRAALVAEVERQWSRFEAVWGGPPDFVDGHQHVHQLPGIRDALLRVMERRLARLGAGARRPWVRVCRGPGWLDARAGLDWADLAKAKVIEALGAASLARRVQRELGLACTRRLLGVSPFDADPARALERWSAWFSLVKDDRLADEGSASPRGSDLTGGDLIMCHPAAPVPGGLPATDAIAQARLMEFDLLRGESFGMLCRRQNVQIARFDAASRTPLPARHEVRSD